MRFLPAFFLGLGALLLPGCSSDDSTPAKPAPDDAGRTYVPDASFLFDAALPPEAGSADDASDDASEDGGASDSSVDAAERDAAGDASSDAAGDASDDAADAGEAGGDGGEPDAH